MIMISQALKTGYQLTIVFLLEKVGLFHIAFWIFIAIL